MWHLMYDTRDSTFLLINPEEQLKTTKDYEKDPIGVKKYFFIATSTWSSDKEFEAAAARNNIVLLYKAKDISFFTKELLSKLEATYIEENFPELLI